MTFEVRVLVRNRAKRREDGRFCRRGLPTISRSRQERLLFCALMWMETNSIVDFSLRRSWGEPDYRWRRFIQGERSLCE